MIILLCFILLELFPQLDRSSNVANHPDMSSNVAHYPQVVSEINDGKCYLPMPLANAYYKRFLVLLHCCCQHSIIYHITFTQHQYDVMMYLFICSSLTQTHIAYTVFMQLKDIMVMLVTPFQEVWGVLLFGGAPIFNLMPFQSFCCQQWDIT